MYNWSGPTACNVSWVEVPSLHATTMVGGKFWSQKVDKPSNVVKPIVLPIIKAQITCTYEKSREPPMVQPCSAAISNTIVFRQTPRSVLGREALGGVCA